MKKQTLVNLSTEYQKELASSNVPFSEYPRPSLRRESYLCLNGEWEFGILSKKGEIKHDGKIILPFAPESMISGVQKHIDKGDLLIYQTTFELNADFICDKVLLHFGAVDQIANVYINDKCVGENVGVLPFSFDVTEFIKVGQNKIKVVAKDDLDKDIPYGKQSNKRGGMWYTKISGIWQTVWLESVPNNYIEKIKITPDLNGITLKVFGGEQQKTATVCGKTYKFSGESVRIDVENPILWSVENPYLYDICIESGKDKVYSYFGLRKVEIKEFKGKKMIALNGKPIFLNGVLDQGYFSDGIYLPASPKAYEDDILAMKKLGFNVLRKHIKLEPELFYYYCDKLGMLVFQDMINSGKYSFIIDTALPTVFLKKGITHRASKKRKEQFTKTCKGIIDNLYNNPSVVYYTIFNEGWGQFDTKNNYRYLKSLDNSRVYDTTSGWFKSKHTDVESDHVYFKKIKPKSVKDNPWLVTEFGGYSYKIKEHSFNLDKTYGYKHFYSEQEFENAILDLYQNQILPCIKNGLNGCIITQLSDVEDETNGFITYDRKVLKVQPSKLFETNEMIKKEFAKRFES